MRVSSPTLKDTYYHDSSTQLDRPDYANCIDLYDTDEKLDEGNKKVHWCIQILVIWLGSLSVNWSQGRDIQGVWILTRIRNRRMDLQQEAQKWIFKFLKIFWIDVIRTEFAGVIQPKEIV